MSGTQIMTITDDHTCCNATCIHAFRDGFEVTRLDDNYVSKFM